MFTQKRKLNFKGIYFKLAIDVAINSVTNTFTMQLSFVPTLFLEDNAAEIRLLCANASPLTCAGTPVSTCSHTEAHPARTYKYIVV